MTTAGWWFFTGIVTAVFISVIFYSVKWNELEKKVEVLEKNVINWQKYAEHLEQLVDPRAWAEDNQMTSVRVKARLYDKYEELYKPGTDVIRIQEENDLPDMPVGWRGKVGDE